MPRLKHVACVVAVAWLLALPALAASPAVTQLDQGPDWTPANRKTYYSQDQGSRIMPLAWMKALTAPDGSPFLADKLARYGYLANTEDPSAELPVGFTTNGDNIGMTCSACHTRQIDVDGTAYRMEGGPAISDFQSFLTDIDTAVRAILASDTKSAAFADAVLGGTPTPAKVSALLTQVKGWYGPYHTIMSRALPPTPWGPSRLDAVGMIFNRLTGLDIGPPPSHIIADNIHTADSPVRYPFIWNAPRQDKTQWPGFADNGDGLLGLARNTGEVIGVFAEFHPFKSPIEHPVLGVNYSVNSKTLLVNSANVQGLLTQEQLVERIGPPKWPWAIDAAKAAKGQEIFNLTGAQGGCAECHAVNTKDADKRLFATKPTWATPVIDVGTDNRQYKMIGVTGNPDFPGWIVDTGALSGAEVRFVFPALAPHDEAFLVLRMAVVGTILQRVPDIGQFILTSDKDNPFLTKQEMKTGVLLKGKVASEIEGAVRKPPAPTVNDKPFRFESRVLQGIWATAPYLHNGSVPTLADLLKTQAERPKAFKLGPAYDTTNVGMAAEQTKFDYTLTTTGCDARSSGTSNCGHEFGTSLTPEQKAALLEYLKTL
jgi:mono/diheme cytochrome c family protein